MILSFFLIWRLALFIITYIGSKTFPLAANTGIGAISQNSKFDFWASWAQWDGGHFYYISKLGYFAPNEYAFFPAYPYLIKFISLFLFGNAILAGLLISNLAFLAFLYLFYDYAKVKLSKEGALTSTVTLLLFPTAYFAVAMYSEGLFLLLTILFFRKLDRKKYLHAAIFAGIAALTRFVGLVLAFCLAVELLQEIKKPAGKIKEKLLAFVISLLPFVAYCTYLFKKFHDPFYFLTVESTWHRTLTNPITTFYSYLATFQVHRPINDRLDVLLPLLFLIILILGFKKIPLTLWIFSALVVLIPASSGTLSSMPRYLLASLGTFAIAGGYLQNNKLRYVLWAISALGQIALAIMFVNGHWTA